MDELLAFLTERRVDRLAYQSIVDLAVELEESLGLRIFDDEEECGRATRITASRNLFAHNAAVVNERYLRQVPTCKRAAGEELRYSHEELFADSRFLADTAARTDTRAAEHFRLPTEVTRMTPPRLDLVDHLGNTSS